MDSRRAPVERLDSIARVAEGDEEGIALRIDLGAAVVGELGTKQITMLGEHCAVSLLQLLDQLGRAIDVGEEKRDGSAGQLRHRTRILPFPPFRS
jgi:hypothetical protein